MFRRILPLALTLLAAPAVAATDTYTLDPYHTFVNFTVDHLGLSTIHGRFGKTTGKIGVDRAAHTASLEVQIDASSVDTGDNERGSRPRSRNEHLRSADFFNAAEFPHAMYKSTRVVFNGDTPATIEGNLTLLGVTKPVALKVERFKCIMEQNN
ncbi:MAG: YceI family protein, partial [Pseudomonadota bacterium]|nr:YceI family protein [Pseudomonadota bacterium]